MGDQKLWDRLRAAARKHGLVALCVRSGYRSQSQSYGLWQLAPRTRRGAYRSPPEFWHASNHMHPPNVAWRHTFVIDDGGRERTVHLPGIARVTLEAPRWT